jgi:hypothetical protein
MVRTIDSTEVEVLRTLPRCTVVLTPTGVAEVVCQLRNEVTVIERGVVCVYERHEVEVKAVEYTAADLAWFRRPLSEVVS